MKFVQISADKRQMFNNYIESVPEGHVFQLFEWGELKNTTGWEPLRFMVLENGVPKGAISILKRKIPGLGRFIFYAPRGPVCALDDYQTMDFMWQQITRLARQHRAVFLKIDPDVTSDNTAFMQYLESRGFKNRSAGKDFNGIQPQYVMRLILNKDEEQLLAEMASKTRYNIRYAKRKGVIIKDNCGLEELQKFYQILIVTAERDKFGIRNYEYFENMYNCLVATGYGKLFVAEYEGEIISGTLALICGDKVWYSYGASDKHRNKQPSYLLQWSMIKWALENNCRIYDFRGISGDLNENNPLYGLYRFKKGFGSEFTEYIGEYDFVFSPVLYQLWEKAMPTAKKLRQNILKLIRR